MATTKAGQVEKRWGKKSCRELEDEVEAMEDFLERHYREEGRRGVRDLMRKEIGGSIWQHGGEGKVLSYKSSKDLADEMGLPSTTKHSKDSTKQAADTKKRQKRTKPRVTDASHVVTGHSVKSLSHVNKPELAVTATEVPKVVPATGEKVADSTSNGLNDTFTISHCKPKLSLPERQIDKRHREVTDLDSRSHMLNKMFIKLNIEEKLKDFKSDSPHPCHDENVVCHPAVSEWIDSLQLKDTVKYYRVFAQHEIDEDSLLLLTEENLKEMSITALGPLNKMISSIRELKLAKRKSKVSSSGSKSRGPASDSSRERNSRPHSAKSQSVATKSTATPTVCVSSLTKSTKKADSSKCASKPVKSSMQLSDKVTCATKNSARKTGQPLQSSRLTGEKPKNTNTKITSREVNLKKARIRPASAAPRAQNVRETSVFNKRSSSAVPAKSIDDSLDLLAEKMNQGLVLDKNKSDAKGPKSEKDVRTDNPVLQEELDTLLSISSAPQRALSSRSVTFAEPEMIENSDVESDSNSQTDTRLQEIENQIRLLQKELTNPSAMKLIVGLEEQLKEVQREIQTQKKSMLSSQLQLPSEKMIHQQPIINAETNDNCSVTMEADDEASIVRDNVVVKETSHSPPTSTHSVTVNGVVPSRAMTKSELLKQVRQQKDQHRKEIRHLESELSRLKHKDPLRSCEIEIKDLSFSESDLLGEGGFSQVFRGSYQGSIVAVKRLKIPLNAQDKNYFTAEVGLLRELRHPRVVLLLGVYMSPSQLPLMVLEYLSEGSLYHYIHNPDKPSFDHAAYYQVAQDIALGMNYLHRHRPPVLHLDLKSMNILLTSHLHAKIADFGFSKLRHESDSSPREKTPGSPCWMSPELLDIGEISTKADVYSFGIILWEMLTRKHPYEGCTVFQVIERVRRGRRPVIPDSCPDCLEQLIRATWAHNPAVRPSFKAIIRSLEQLHFPAEWRALFKVAGVPKAVLEHAETSRTLIEIVNSGTKCSPAPVPPLDLDLSTDDLPISMIDVNGKKDVDNHGQLKESSRKLAWSAQKPPPAPPVIPSDLRPLPHGTSSHSHTDSTSLFSQLKSSLQNPQLKSVGEQSHSMKPGKHFVSRGQGHCVTDNELMKQMNLLKPTSQPHPSQLRDLTHVESGQLNDLADVLKRAVVERRWSLHCTDDHSPDSSRWTSDDSD